MNAEHPPNDDLKVLHDFLGAFDQSALAHARADLTDEEKREIEGLAQGQLTPEQRSSLLPVLATNENAIELLASLLKSGA
ncbi:hypothetical protein OKA05_21630 [Luteolibacter arcticus]|uniref:Uncharacterized protein n=1 Tax=Luteolibacter arcticus TaxID=1581411 RepID=A0ABT3GNR9_9BACT|nr:hypothetical protein [Luteolibacter arcticus]MCW1925176.1 hypothetical protein [Luteolibacter arcticus]